MNGLPNGLPDGTGPSNTDSAPTSAPAPSNATTAEAYSNRLISGSTVRIPSVHETYTNGWTGNDLIRAFRVAFIDLRTEFANKFPTNADIDTDDTVRNIHTKWLLTHQDTGVNQFDGIAVWHSAIVRILLAELWLDLVSMKLTSGSDESE